MSLPRPPLLVITDRALARRPVERAAAAALAGGCLWIMVRDKGVPPAELARLTAAILGLARPCGATVLVNGDIDVALACGADGVHLPQGGSPEDARRRLGLRALIGVSAHDLSEVEAARRGGADYVTLSPIFSTASKPGYGPALGLDGLRAAVARGGLPVLALGGVTAANAAACRAAGATGIAVMGTVMAAAEPEAATAGLIRALASQAFTSSSA